MRIVSSCDISVLQVRRDDRADRFCHLSRSDQKGGLGFVRLGPVAVLAARGETLGVLLGVHRFRDAVDPTEAQSLIDGLVVADTCFAGSLLIALQPDLLL